MIVDSYKNIDSRWQQNSLGTSPINEQELNLIKNHLNFSCFVDHIPFDKYLLSYSILSREKEAKKLRLDYDEANINSKESSVVLKALANAITDPDIMELIVQKFILNLKI